MKPHLDAVIEACKTDPQFRWTIESVWQLQAWLDRTHDPAQVDRLTALLRSGQIELSAADGSMHTEFMGSEELNRLIYAARSAGKRFGIDPQVAMMNDAPGFSFRLPQVLARSGVKYFITGSNIAFGGGTSLWPGRMPFYWEGPDGSRVLMWQTQSKDGGYTEGMATYYLAPSVEDPYLHTRFYPKEWSGLPDLEITQRGIETLLRKYNDAGYEHSAAAVLFMHDGIGPEYELNGLLPNVRAWNAAGKLPHLVVATPSEFFAYIVAHDGKSLPVYRGDWSGLWSHVKLNSPAMSADARWLQDRLPQTETLWSLLRMDGIDAKYPTSDLAGDYQHLFVYDEHNGAGQGGWPKVMTRNEVLEQNQQYSSLLRSARSSVDQLLQIGLAQIPKSAGSATANTILVFNPLDSTASHLVLLRDTPGSFSFRDVSTGKVVPSQRLSSGELCFEARDVPPIGYRAYTLETAQESQALPISDDTVLSSPFFKVELDPSTGAVIRITDLRQHRIIVDAARGGKAAELEVAPASRWAISLPRAVIRHESGPVLDRVVIERPQSLWPRTVITLPQLNPTVHITESLDRNRMPFVPYKGEGIDLSFAFRFSLPDSAQRWIEDGNGLYRFPQEMLSGARTDAAVPRHVLVWSTNAGTGYSVMLSQREAFFDNFKAGADRSKSPIVDGVDIEAMVKSDQSDTSDAGVTTIDSFEPDYPALKEFSFDIAASTGPPDPAAAYRNGMNEEYQAVMLPHGVTPQRPVASLLSVSASNVIIQDLKPSIDGEMDHYMLRLQEVAGHATRLRLRLSVPVTSIAETSLTEDRILRSGLSANNIMLTPHQTMTLRLTMTHRHLSAAGER